MIDVMSEEAVVDGALKVLEKEGWSLVSRADSHGPGDDLRMEMDGRTLVVEAKGAGSSRPGSNRYGQRFTANQCRDHVANAVLKAMCALDLGHEAAIALPCMLPPEIEHPGDYYLTQVNLVARSLERLGVRLIWVMDTSLP